MLFMMISTWEPWATLEIRNRIMEKGIIAPEGGKLISYYTDAGSGRQFITFEAENTESIFKAVANYSDIIKFEIVPIVEYELVPDIISQQ